MLLHVMLASTRACHMVWVRGWVMHLGSVVLDVSAFDAVIEHVFQSFSFKV
jgi:hypothetical protein